MKGPMEWIPVVNLLIVILGFFYGISILKIALAAFTKELDKIASLAYSTEHRVTILESSSGKESRYLNATSGA